MARQYEKIQEVVACPLTELGDSSVTLTLKAWCADAADSKQIEYDVYEQAKQQFEAAGIEIPYPYQNVVLQNRPGS